MNKKTIISLVLGCISVLPASAQNGWFVEAGGGVQTIFSSDASKLDFGKRLTPSYTIGVGSGSLRLMPFVCRLEAMRSTVCPHRKDSICVIRRPTVPYMVHTTL